MSSDLPGLRPGPLPPPWHLPGIIAGWLLFAWLWWLVASQPWQATGLQRLVVGAAVLFPVVTLAWIAHNRNIYRRLGPRRGLRVVPLRYEADFFGRAVDADWPALQQAQLVVIDIEGNRKRFRPDMPAEDAP